MANRRRRNAIARESSRREISRRRLTKRATRLHRHQLSRLRSHRLVAKELAGARSLSGIGQTTARLPSEGEWSSCAAVGSIEISLSRVSRRVEVFVEVVHLSSACIPLTPASPASTHGMWNKIHVTRTHARVAKPRGLCEGAPLSRIFTQYAEVLCQARSPCAEFASARSTSQQ